MGLVLQTVVRSTDSLVIARIDSARKCSVRDGRVVD